MPCLGLAAGVGGAFDGVDVAEFDCIPGIQAGAGCGANFCAYDATLARCCCRCCRWAALAAVAAMAMAAAAAVAVPVVPDSQAGLASSLFAGVGGRVLFVSGCHHYHHVIGIGGGRDLRRLRPGRATSTTGLTGAGARRETSRAPTVPHTARLLAAADQTCNQRLRLTRRGPSGS